MTRRRAVLSKGVRPKKRRIEKEEETGDRRKEDEKMETKKGNEEKENWTEDVDEERNRGNTKLYRLEREKARRA